MARGDEPCGRTVREAIMKTVCWIDRVAEWAVDSRATSGIPDSLGHQGHARRAAILEGALDSTRA